MKDLSDPYGLTWFDEGVITHLGGHVGLYGQVFEPVTQLVMIRCDKAALITVEGVPDAKADPKAVTVAGKVWGFYDVSKECIIPPYWAPISVLFISLGDPLLSV